MVAISGINVQMGELSLTEKNQANLMMCKGQGIRLMFQLSSSVRLECPGNSIKMLGKSLGKENIS